MYPVWTTDLCRIQEIRPERFAQRVVSWLLLMQRNPPIYGHAGEQLSQPSESSEALDTYSYLNGTVIHYKMNTRGHNASGGLTEAMLLKFLDSSN
jgi:hypothetical protein